MIMAFQMVFCAFRKNIFHVFSLKRGGTVIWTDLFWPPPLQSSSGMQSFGALQNYLGGLPSYLGTARARSRQVIRGGGIHTHMPWDHF